MSGVLTVIHNGRIPSRVPVLSHLVDNLVHEIPLEVKNDGRSELTVHITPNKSASIVASLSKEDQCFVLIGGAKRTVTIHMDTRDITLKKLKQDEKKRLDLNIKFENPASWADIPIVLNKRDEGRFELDTPAPNKLS